MYTQKIVVYVMSNDNRHFVTARNTQRNDQGQFTLGAEFFKRGMPIDDLDPQDLNKVAQELGLALLGKAGVQQDAKSRSALMKAPQTSVSE